MTDKLFNINCVYVIESLKDNEFKTGTHLMNDIIRYRAEQLGIRAGLITVNSKQSLFEALNVIKENLTNSNLFPYIHFEIHGCKTGFEMSSGELVVWDDIYSSFVEINYTLKNKLLVSLATCYGAYIFNIMDPLKRAPFYAYIAPVGVVLSGNLERDFTEYFDVLLTTRSFNSALEALNRISPEVPYMYHSCDLLFDYLEPRLREEYQTKHSIRKKFKDLFIQTTSPNFDRKYNRKQSRAYLREHIRKTPRALKEAKFFF